MGLNIYYMDMTFDGGEEKKGRREREREGGREGEKRMRERERQAQ